MPVLAVFLVLFGFGCVGQREATAVSRSQPGVVPPAGFRCDLCSEAPLRLDGPPGAQQTQGCVVRFTQATDDPQVIAAYGRHTMDRRYIVYVPERLPDGPVPLLVVLPGYGANAEAAAFYYTHTRFEQLATRDGFVVVYGNGLPDAPGGEQAQVPQAGYFRGCLSAHTGEGIDVQYVRQIVAQLETKLPIDRSRLYATGLSAGGGLSFQLAMEAPDLVAAIAPVAPLPFQPTGAWRFHCQPKPGHERVSILMVAGTADRFISYQPGPSPEYPGAHYPGMEQTRDNWLRVMGITGEPKVTQLEDVVPGDSYPPHSGVSSSFVLRHVYPRGPSGQQFVYYKIVGMGHWWPDPIQSWSGLWSRFGKTNQDISLADHVWEFFRNQRKQG
jgi:polyhydroxybutyrate depolymerase